MRTGGFPWIICTPQLDAPTALNVTVAATRRREVRRSTRPREYLTEREIETKPCAGVARALLVRAQDGDVRAIQEIGDRMDGKVPRSLVGDDQGDPITLRTIITGVERASRPLPTAAR